MKMVADTLKPSANGVVTDPVVEGNAPKEPRVITRSKPGLNVILVKKLCLKLDISTIPFNNLRSTHLLV